MIVKIGEVNIAGPNFRVQQTGNKSNFNFTGSGNGNSVCVSEDDESTTRDLTFQAWALGGCSVADAQARVDAVQAQLDLANSSNGHIVFYQRIDDWVYRRELVSGKIDFNSN